jgi:hypothetical protein
MRETFHAGAQHRRVLLVGIARAIQWACVSAVDGEPFREMSLFWAAASTGQLAIQIVCPNLKHIHAELRGARNIEPIRTSHFPVTIGSFPGPSP